jgi:hypothetical protein
VNGLDLAVISALRYGRSLRPTDVTAVHFMIDATQADALRARWERYGIRTKLKIIDCPDRRLPRAAQRLAIDYAGKDQRTGVTLLLPRRTYAPLLGRLLHDRTADRIARVISPVPRAAATIVPYDVQSRLRETFPNLPEERITRSVERLRHRLGGSDPAELREHEHPDTDATPIAALRPGRRAVVEGRLSEITETNTATGSALSGLLCDASGNLTVRFAPRDDGELSVGQLLRVQGVAARPGADGELTMIHPDLEVLQQPEGEEADDHADDHADGGGQAGGTGRAEAGRTGDTAR